MDTNYLKLFKRTDDSQYQIVREFVHNYVLTTNRRLHINAILVRFKNKYKYVHVEPQWFNTLPYTSQQLRTYFEIGKNPNNIAILFINIVNEKHVDKLTRYNEGQLCKLARTIYWDVLFDISHNKMKLKQILQHFSKPTIFVTDI